MSGEETKKAVESLPLIEKLLNLKSLMLLWILMLWVDMALIFDAGHNLLSYPWHDSHIHYGKVGIALGIGVTAYVLLIPLFIQLSHMLWVFAPKFMQSNDEFSAEYRAAHDSVRLSALYEWAVKHDDKMALEIWQKRDIQNRQTSNRAFEFQVASVALLILLLVECNFVPNSVCAIFLSHLSERVLNVTQTLIWGLPILIWWVNTGAVTEGDRWVYYPKAVVKKSK
jgi:hypothetical protein